MPPTGTSISSYFLLDTQLINSEYKVNVKDLTLLHMEF